MTENAIYTTFFFKDKNTDELIHQLTVRNQPNKFECVRRTIMELTEKYCLPSHEIVVEGT